MSTVRYGANPCYAFGPFLLDPNEKSLWRDGVPVPITPKATETLILLVQQNGHTVTRDELIETVWQDTAVEEGNLSVCVFMLRKALGQTEDGKSYIETVPRRGYRFNACVGEVSDSDGLLVERLSVSRVTIEEEESEAIQLDSPFAKTKPRLMLRLVAGGLALLIVAAVVYLWRGAKPQAGGANIRSIAVLPLRSLNKQSNDDELRMGLADALITRLGMIRYLSVRPTSSVRGFLDVDRDSRELGKALDVDALLEGNIQQDNGRLRVTLQMIRVSDGTQLWAGKFDEDYRNIFAVQDSISVQVVQALRLNLTPVEQQQMARRPTENVEAFYDYLRGRHHWNKRNRGVPESVKYFQAALDKDPTFVLAYVGLADAFAMLDVPSPKAEAAIQRALDLDPNSAEAHATAGFLKLFHHWEWTAAEAEFQRGLSLNPTYSNTYLWRAVLLQAQARFPEAEAAMKQALELDPLSLPINADLGYIYYTMHRYDAAEFQLRRTLEIEPTYQPAHDFLFHIYLRQGKFKEAVDSWTKAWGDSEEAKAGFLREGQEAFLRRTIKQNDLMWGTDFAFFESAQYCMALGEREKALDYLEKAHRAHNYNMLFVKVEPLFDELHDEARFKEILRQMSL